MNWSDDEGLWEAMLPALAAPDRYSSADAEVATILARVSVDPGSAVLDVGCGAGVHAVAFAARGYRVTGIDTSVALLDAARTRAESQHVSVEFAEADMRAFVRPEQYELACSLNSSFAYFDHQTNMQVLLNIRESLAASGTLVVDTLGEGVTSEVVTEQSAAITGVRYASRRVFNAAAGVLEESWTVDSGALSRRFESRQRVYTAAELSLMLRQVGFSSVTISASLDGAAAYTDESVRLVGVAKRG